MSNDPNPIPGWLNRIAHSGYRLTAPRRAIVDIMASSDRALEPLQVYDLGRQICPGLGLVTVYRTLEKLEELGLIQRVHQPNGCHTYWRAAQGHEHLLFCTACGRAVHFSGDDITPLIEKVTGQTHFTIQDHWLQLFGLCPQCKPAAI